MKRSLQIGIFRIFCVSIPPFDVKYLKKYSTNQQTVNCVWKFEHFANKKSWHIFDIQKNDFWWKSGWYWPLNKYINHSNNFAKQAGR